CRGGRRSIAFTETLNPVPLAGGLAASGWAIELGNLPTSGARAGTVVADACERLRSTGLVTPGFVAAGAGGRCPPMAANTSVIARACSSGDLSILRWPMLGLELRSTLLSEPWKPGPGRM